MDTALFLGCQVSFLFFSGKIIINNTMQCECCKAGITLTRVNRIIFPPWRKIPWWTRAFCLSRLYNHTLWDILQSVGLLWVSDQPIAKSFGWQQTTFTVDQLLCSPRGLNSQSWQDSRWKTMPYIARPPGSGGKTKVTGKIPATFTPSPKQIWHWPPRNWRACRSQLTE
jgi:hypothetical protein